MKIKPFYKIDPSDWILTNQGDVAASKKKAISEPHKDQRQIEEYVRQWVLKELFESYSYPKDWLGEKIIIEETVQVASSEKESDISLKNDRGRTYIFIETKNSSINGREFDKAEKQLETYLSSTHTATIGLITNGITTKVIRKKVNPNDFEYIADIPEYGGNLGSKYRLKRDIESIKESSKKVGLTPLPKNHSNKLSEAHNSLRDIDGLHDDLALDELCKIIYSKIYDERKSTQGKSDYEFRFQSYGKSSSSEIASEIRDLYKEACEFDLTIYSQRIPNYQRSRGVFQEQIGLSDVALSRVVEILQDFSIVDSGVDIKSSAFQKVLGKAMRAGMGQFFTPDEIVNIAVEVIKPSPRDLILDPFSGSGHFLSKSLEYVEKEYSNLVDDYVMNQFKMFHLHGIEKSSRMVRIAMTDMLIHNDGHSNIRHTDSLLTFENYPDILAIPGDENKKPEIFDIILTNPPFGSLMREDARKMLGRFTIAGKKKSVPLEVLALERCFQFLKRGGKLAIVLPDGNLANSDVQVVRDWLIQNMMLKGVISLPSETFSPFGTTTKTSLCFFQKKFNNEVIDNRDYDVCFYKLENIGYDATGRSRLDSEINDCTKYMSENIYWDKIND